jgi:hypothetical protein
MPASRAEYQKQYREKNKHRTKNVTVTLPISLHKEFQSFADEQGISLSNLLRESADLQIRQSKLKARAITKELRELRFLISNVANNVNQMAHHSNRLKQVLDENAVFTQLRELDEMVTKFVDNRLNDPS